MNPFISIALLALSIFVFACEKENEGPIVQDVAFKGSVRGVTNNPLKSVTVKMFDVKTGAIVSSTETKEDGSFDFDIPPGYYALKIVCDGYSPFEQQLTINAPLVAPPVTLSGTAIFTGTVLNSQTAQGLPGVQVTFARDIAQGETDHGTEFTVTTDPTGRYELAGAPRGKFVGRFMKNDFLQRETNIVLNEGANGLQQVVCVERPAQGALRILLTWGTIPQDLDSHLVGPAEDGTKFHLFFDSKVPTPSTSLDVDVTKGYGPETITIHTLEPGVYQYSVLDYNHGRSDIESPAKMASSPTLVEIFNSEGLIESFGVPSGFEGDANLFTMFEIVVNNGTYAINPLSEWHLRNSYEGWGDGRLSAGKKR